MRHRERKHKIYGRASVGPTFIEANLGCMGLYRSFLDCGAGAEVSSSKG